LTGARSVVIPDVASWPAQTAFIQEGGAAAAVQFGTGSVRVGPTRTMRIVAGMSREIAEYSQAAVVIQRVLGAAVLKSLDFTAFGAQLDDEITPSGVLNSATIVAASTSIAGANIDVSGLVYVAAPRQAVEMKARLSPKFDYPVMSTLALADKTVACFAPAALASSYEDPLIVEASTTSAIVFQDSSPGAPLAAAPTLSPFQNELIVLRLKARCAWAPKRQCDPRRTAAA
jgi:hypothetical protein